MNGDPFYRHVLRSFVTRGGLQFRRRADGAVELWRQATTTERLPTYAGMQVRRVAIFPANEWASILATMTVLGEDRTTYAIALALHTGSKPYDAYAHEHDASTAEPLRYSVTRAGASALEFERELDEFDGTRLDKLEPLKPAVVGLDDGGTTYTATHRRQPTECSCEFCTSERRAKRLAQLERDIIAKPAADPTATTQPDAIVAETGE